VELALDGILGPGSIHRCFVSILVFVELALDGQEAVEFYLEAAFQSLFSWNLLLMSTHGAAVSALTSCFNPCFRGTCS